jgi:hyperosmotically inducible periplasmic protein
VAKFDKRNDQERERENAMKKTIDYWKKNAPRLAAILCLSVGPVLIGSLVTGCAGDRYHESTGESIDDTAITARVKSALGGDPQFKYDDIHVTTFKGTVQLSGFVNSRDARSHAVELAKNTEGVKDVTDSIDLK